MNDVQLFRVRPPELHRRPLKCKPLDLMSEELPQFKYHPSPLVTGMVEPSSTLCGCCQQVRCFIYVGPVHGEQDLQESLCPWCIADGSASTHLGTSFADDLPLRKADLHESIIAEVHLRTPAYTSWQQEEWLTHCNDACEYHGDASVTISKPQARRLS